MESRIRLTCSKCGSTNVARDAWAVWDESTQCFYADHIFDVAHCFECDGETSLNEENIDD